MVYKAYLKQRGEGCDYTIGCGQKVVDIIAHNINEAKQKLVEMIKEDYCGEYALANCEIYECTNILSLDVNKIYNQVEQARKKEEDDRILQQEKLEFERLMKKFIR